MSEIGLEAYELKAMKIVHAGEETLLGFSDAILYVDTSDIERSWFVDISDMSNHGLLKKLAGALDIRIMMYARTVTQLEIAGEGFLHPNLALNHATIKGNGELFGYEQIRETC